MNIRSLYFIFLLSACAQSKFEPSKITAEVCQDMAGKESKLTTPSTEKKIIFENDAAGKIKILQVP